MDEISKKFAHNRIKKPLFHYFGSLTPEAIFFFLKQLQYSDETLAHAMKLREQYVQDQLYKNYLKDYHQYDIQFQGEEAEYGDERDYHMFREDFKPHLEEIVQNIGTLIYRTRYATIENNDTLDWHIDQPHHDRFIIVLQGEQEFQIKVRKKIMSQTMKVGDIWFINSSWEHRVINTGEEKRIALLGCFEYNVGNEDNK